MLFYLPPPKKKKTYHYIIWLFILYKIKVSLLFNFCCKNCPWNFRIGLMRTLSTTQDINDEPISIKEVVSARSRIQRYIHRTPIFTSSTFNQLYNRNFYFKGEHLQKTGSFKIRGALNAVSKYLLSRPLSPLQC